MFCIFQNKKIMKSNLFMGAYFFLFECSETPVNKILNKKIFILILKFSPFVYSFEKKKGFIDITKKRTINNNY